MNDVSRVRAGYFRGLARAAMKARMPWVWAVTAGFLLLNQVLGYTLVKLSAVAIWLPVVLLFLVWVAAGYGYRLLMLRRLRGGGGPRFLCRAALRPLPVCLLVNLLVNLSLRVSAFGLRFIDLRYGTNGGIAIGMAFVLAGVALSVWMHLSLDMAWYLAAAEPERGAFDLVGESFRRMRGHRRVLFRLVLSHLGWLLLGFVPAEWIISGLRAAMGTHYVGLAWVSELVIAILCSLPEAYVTLSVLAFYEAVSGKIQPPAEAYRPVRQRTGVEAAASDAPLGADIAAKLLAGKPYREPTDDEHAAYAMLWTHGFSPNRMRQAGVYEDYLALRVQPDLEAAWRDNWASRTGITADKSRWMDEVLSVSVECGDTKLLMDVLFALDADFNQRGTPDAEVLERCLEVARAINSGAFDQAPEGQDQARGLMAKLAGKLEARLNAEDPKGTWRGAMKQIKARC